MTLSGQTTRPQRKTSSVFIKTAWLERSGSTISRRVVILVRMLNKVVQRPLLVTRKATVPSAVMRSRQQKQSKGTGLYKHRGCGSCDIELLSHDLVTFRDEMENDHYS